jgi:RNA polymerase sigma-70 factor (ECF subfamily)
VLVRRYRGVVFAVCFEYTGNLADSEDLTQEAFVAAHRSLSSLREPEKIVAWLRAIARNVCRMHQRQQRPETTPVDDLVASTGTVTDANRNLEIQNLVHGALLKVTERSREVLSLYYLGGYSYKEIAALCDLPLQTVRSRLHEARSQLKSRLLETVAELCRCSRDGDHTVRCVLERCGTEPCECVTRLLDD